MAFSEFNVIVVSMLRSILFSAAYLATLSANAEAQAWTGNSLVPQAEVRDAASSGRTIPFQKIVKKLNESFEGELVDAALYSNGKGGYEYDVIWIDGEGRRLSITLDALTGDILKTQGGN
jgi:uncharacterized membrane protein YkoI